MAAASAPTPQQSEENTLTRRALPEHAQQESGKPWRIDESENQLQHIHNVIELPRDVSSGHRNRQSEDRRCSSHPPIVLVGRAAIDGALVDIVSPYGI